MKKVTTMTVVVMVLAFGGSSALADHHHEKTIKELIKEHFQLLAKGENEKRVELFHSEVSGFTPNGGLLEKTFSTKTREQLIGRLNKQYEEGTRYRLTPKHINVMVDEDGNSAFATHYLEGTVTQEGEEGEKEHVRDRLTVVFTKEGGEWKIIHWHSSPLKSADEEEHDD